MNILNNFHAHSFKLTVESHFNANKVKRKSFQILSRATARQDLYSHVLPSTSAEQF